MKVLIACEESQVVCKAFRAKGHEAYSCDLQECSGGHPEWHISGDVVTTINGGFFNTQNGDLHEVWKWNLMIGHPPCTYLSYVGTQHWNRPGRLIKRLAALDFFAQLWLAPIEKICLENPRGCASPTIAKYSQEINPFFFGDEFSKPTWLWLKDLPMLIHYKTNTLFSNQTHVSKGEFITRIRKDGNIKKEAKWFSDAIYLAKEDRAKFRSKTFPGIANAMAEQWG